MAPEEGVLGKILPRKREKARKQLGRADFAGIELAIQETDQRSASGFGYMEIIDR
jgi:hypothetical protein